MKYLNGILTVIAACLVLITFAVTGIIPSAKAGEPPTRTVTLPLNPDGSVNVKWAPGTIQDVNIKEINGSSYGKLDVNIKEVGGSSTYGKINVNIEEVDGSSISRSVPVKMAN